MHVCTGWTEEISPLAWKVESNVAHLLVPPCAHVCVFEVRKRGENDITAFFSLHILASTVTSPRTPALSVSHTHTRTHAREREREREQKFLLFIVDAMTTDTRARFLLVRMQPDRARLLRGTDLQGSRLMRPRHGHACFVLENTSFVQMSGSHFCLLVCFLTILELHNRDIRFLPQQQERESWVGQFLRIFARRK